MFFSKTWKDSFQQQPVALGIFVLIWKGWYFTDELDLVLLISFHAIHSLLPFGKARAVPSHAHTLLKVRGKLLGPQSAVTVRTDTIHTLLQRCWRVAKGWWKCYKRCSVGQYVGGSAIVAARSGGRTSMWNQTQYLNYSCLHCRVAKTQEFKVTSGMYSDMLSSLPWVHSDMYSDMLIGFKRLH